MTKKAIRIALALLGLAPLALTIPAVYETTKSMRLWNDLRSALRQEDMEQVNRLLADSPQDLHTVEGTRVLYFGHDYSGKLVQERASFIRTLEYYLTDPQRKRFGKVVLAHGFARIEGGRITFLKFP
jgi:hypothetical protein